jgi:predicted nucleic acid-binding protein
MLNLLIDTCVWLDIAKEAEQQKTLRVLLELMDMGEVKLLLPETVLNEFNNNKERIIKESNQSLSSAIKRTKKAVEKLGSNAVQQLVLDQLDDINYKITHIPDSTANSIEDIEKLFTKTTLLPATETIKLNAAKRAVDKLAPFHKNKNSFNDAIIIETYGAQGKDGNKDDEHFAFVTHNTSDFSLPNGNQKKPHPDFAAYFDQSDVSSSYYINLAEALRDISPDLVSDLMVEQEDWDIPPRELSEIIREENKLFEIIWYHRYKMRVYRITEEVNASPEIKNKQKEIKKRVLEVAINGAKKIEKKHGKQNLGPWDDFELGMLHGKLSALRWMLGDDWDFLDT